MSEEFCKHCGRPMASLEIYETCACEGARSEAINKINKPFDYTCIIHGKKMSEHPPYGCLYCCLCFCDLTPDQCHVRPDGKKEDVCNQCAEEERKHNESRTNTQSGGAPDAQPNITDGDR